MIDAHGAPPVLVAPNAPRLAEVGRAEEIIEMGNEWSNEIGRTRESDAHVAASLTSALIARATHPCGTSAVQEAENAVNLYRCVLAALSAGEPYQRQETATPTMDSAAMQRLGVSRDGVKFRYKTFLYDKLDDALGYARLDHQRQLEGA